MTTERLDGLYKHSKTGNIYEYLHLVNPTDEVPKLFTTLFKARCCENKVIEVKIYKQENTYYYTTHENPDLHENDKVKVLYERDGVLWLRSEEDFHKLVTIEGETVPRFEKIE